MAGYPNAIPTIATLTGSDYPKAEHLNIPNREIEAICLELGINPRTIDDAVVPRPNPQNVGHYLDMIAYIVKTMSGASSWFNAAVPLRQMIVAGYAGGTIGAGGTTFLMPWTKTATTEAICKIPMPYAGKATVFRGHIIGAQPGTGSLVWTVRKNVADTTATFTMAAGAASGTKGVWTGSIAFDENDFLSVSILNNAPSASALIGTWSVGYNQ